MIRPEDLLIDLEPACIKSARYVNNGKNIPSVTELLSFIDSSGLINWANRIGRQGIDNQEILKTAAKFGTNTHSAIEKYLKGEPPFVDNSAFKAFQRWWEGLNSANKVEILGQEEPLVSDYFAGTYDLLISINDKPYLVDFKTSNSVGYKYFMQIAAYRYLLYIKKNINIQGAIVLKLGKGPKPKFQEFALDFDNPEHYCFIENCLRSFMGVVYTYHNTENCKERFDSIFG